MAMFVKHFADFLKLFGHLFEIGSRDGFSFGGLTRDRYVKVILGYCSEGIVACSLNMSSIWPQRHCNIDPMPMNMY